MLCILFLQVPLVFSSETDIILPPTLALIYPTPLFHGTSSPPNQTAFHERAELSIHMFQQRIRFSCIKEGRGRLLA